MAGGEDDLEAGEDDLEASKDLRLRRGHGKGKLTRSLKKLHVLAEEESFGEMESLLLQLKIIYRDFMTLHEAVAGEVPTDDDDEYVDEVQDTYCAAIKRAKDVLRARPKETDTKDHVQFAATPKLELEERSQHHEDVPDPPVTVSALSKLMSYVQMPKREINIYNGDPMKFWPFIRSFDALMDREGVENNDKLLCLLSRCTGKALRAIEAYSMMEDGYVKARDVLFKRFGTTFQIADTWVQHMTSGLQLQPSDSQGLRDFADDLLSCVECLAAMDSLAEINTQRVLKQLSERLPMYLRLRWRGRVQKLRKTSSREPNIDQLMEFVEDAAQEVNHPVYGDVADSKPNRKAQSFNALSKNNCIICDSDCKTLFHCKRFEQMNAIDRFQAVRTNRLCFNCLQSGHFSIKCPSQKVCSIDGCGRKHARLLHREQRRRTLTADVPTQRESVPWTAGGGGANALVNVATDRSAVLPVTAVRVRANGQTVMVNALLDTGSTISFCTYSLVHRLSLAEEQTSLSLTTMACTNKAVRSSFVKFEVSDVRGSDWHRIRTYTRSSIDVGRTVLPECDGFSHLKGLNFCTQDEVCLLIGQDYAALLMPLEIRKSSVKEPYAVRTPLGWSLHGGRVGTQVGNQCHVTHLISIEKQLERFWRIEEWSEVGLGRSVSDARVLKLWDGAACMDGNHYQLPIPFRDDNVRLPENISMVEQRMASLKRKLQKDERLRVNYTSFMDDLQAKGFAEPVIEGVGVKGKIWYLPHHSVHNPKKPDKTRVVFDCAARFAGASLNSKALSGPDLNNSLIGVLIRFRMHSVAVTADIESMFHQVRVNPSDRDVLRYLWWPEGDLSKELKVYRMAVHLFGGTWSPSCCSYALRKTAIDHPEFDEKTVSFVLRNFYVDDCLFSVETEQEAVFIVSELISLLKLGGFNLTKWACSRKGVLMNIPVEKRSKNLESIDITRDALPGERILGVEWSAETDSFQFNVHLPEKSITRRGLLSMTSSLYDPLGFVAPFTLLPKKLMQNLCRKNFGWDEPLPFEVYKDWREWVSQLSMLNEIAVPRVLRNPREVSRYRLHLFADASSVAYGAVCYLSVIYADDSRSCSFVIAKSRLAPLQQMSIPRLELAAAALAVRLESNVKQELDYRLQDSVFWTDSMIVLGYITNEDKRFQTFVANRVSLIHRMTRPDQWRHVPSQENPADDLSRGLTADALKKSSRWFHGPEFLLHDSLLNNQAFNVDVNDPELKRESVPTHAAEAAGETAVITSLFGRFSSWISLKRFVAAWLKVKRWLRAKVGRNCDDVSIKFTMVDMREAEVEIIRCVQKLEFGEFEDGSLKVSRSSKLFRLGVVSQAGILYVVGRHCKAPDDVPLAMKRQVLLPNHHVADLIVSHFHSITGHGGREHTLASLRTRYWILGSRRLIRRVIGRCVICRRWKQPPGEQKMADLPDCRVSHGNVPFTHVGIDVFGPFLVKRGRSQVKRYGCIFTCLTMRAIHLEILHSLETDSFINALIRFVSRRGCPEHIWCDNGTNFVGAERVLRDGLMKIDHKRVDSFLLSRDVQWHFNPPTASHMGGAWERMIRTVRKVLAPLLKQQVLDDEGLLTLIVVVEDIVNGRPLTAVSTDPNDLGPLTPNDLIRPSDLSRFSLNDFDFDALCRRRWKQVQYLGDQFWSRWLKEYFPSLKARQKWSKERVNFRVGDLVIITDTCRRAEWPLARITDVFPSADGLVRKAKVKTGSSTFIRPIAKLCLLEAATSR